MSAPAPPAARGPRHLSRGGRGAGRGGRRRGPGGGEGGSAGAPAGRGPQRLGGLGSRPGSPNASAEAGRARSGPTHSPRRTGWGARGTQTRTDRHPPSPRARPATPPRGPGRWRRPARALPGPQPPPAARQPAGATFLKGQVAAIRVYLGPGLGLRAGPPSGERGGRGRALRPPTSLAPLPPGK